MAVFVSAEDVSLSSSAGPILSLARLSEIFVAVRLVSGVREGFLFQTRDHITDCVCALRPQNVVSVDGLMCAVAEIQNVDRANSTGCLASANVPCSSSQRLPGQDFCAETSLNEATEAKLSLMCSVLGPTSTECQSTGGIE